MEELLNKLIEKGWKPFGKWKKRKVFARWDKTVSFSYQDDEWIEFYTYLIRDVVSKESWLWQFVCENGMVDKQHWYIEELKWWKADDDEEWHDNWEERYSTEYQYWLIESSLKDESELESFILDNIKV